MNYPDSVRYLYSLGNELKTLKFGLETIGAVTAALGHPEARLPIRARRRHQWERLDLRHD